MPRILILLAVVAALAGRAEAQSAPWQPDRITPGWTFTPGAGIGMFRDGNVTLRPGAPSRRAEWVLLLTPRGELDFNGRRTRMNLGYAGTLEAFRQNEHLNRYQQFGRFGVGHTFSPRVAVRSGASYRVAPTTDDLEDLTVPFSAVGSRTVNLSAGLSGALSPRARLDASYTFDEMRFDDQVVLDPLFQFLRGGHGHTPSVQLSYRTSPRTSLTGSWSYTRGSVLGELSTFDVQQVGGGWSHQISQYTTIGGDAGVALFRVHAVDLGSWQPTFRGYVEQQVSRSTFSVAYQQTVAPSYTNGALSRTQSIRAGARSPIALGRAYVSGGITFSRTEPVEGLTAGLNARTVWVNGAVGYWVTRWLSTEGYVNTSRQTPLGNSASSIGRTRIGFLFVTSKPVRID